MQRKRKKKAERESGKEEMKINYLRVGHSVGKILGVSYQNTKLQVEEVRCSCINKILPSHTLV